MKTLLFVPCFNCREQVSEVLRRLNTPEAVNLIDAIMVVDNCSSDGTIEALKEIAAQEMDLWSKDRIHLQANRRNKGLGGSFRDASLWAKKNDFTHLALFHGDHQAQVDDLIGLLSQPDEHATLLGARFMKGSRRKRYPLRRTLGNLALNKLFSSVMGRKIYDIGSGLNIYRLEDLNEDFLRSLPGHIAFDLKVLFHLVDHEKKISFRPIQWKTGKERSTINEWEVGTLVLKLLYQWKFHKEQRPRIHVVFPMAGKGSRFRDQGFEMPKPFLQYQKQSFFRRSLRSVIRPLSRRGFDISLTVITSSEDGLESLVTEEVLDHFPTIKFSSILIQGRTQGPVETLLHAQNRLSLKDQLLIVDCDLEFKSPAFFDSFMQESLMDGALVTFPSDSPRYSFVSSDDDGKALAVAEKEVISDRALIGAYYFRSSESFFRQAAETLRHLRKSKEVYVSHVIQDLIKSGRIFRVSASSAYKSFGSPQELEELKRRFNEAPNNFLGEESQLAPIGTFRNSSTSELHSEP